MTQVVTFLKEDSEFLKHPSVNTITFYTGDVESAITTLKGRVTELFKANPWLTGRLKSSAESGVCALHYDEKTLNDLSEDKKFEKSQFLEPYFSDIIRNLDKPIDVNLTIANLEASEALVKTGAECLDADEAIFKVRVIKSASSNDSLETAGSSSPRNKFAVTVSMSHVVGDGYTYYTLLTALTGKVENSKIPSMKIERLENYGELRLQKMGPSLGTQISFSLISGIMGKLMKSGLGIIDALKFSAFYINEEEVEKRKLAAKGKLESVPFVSTNDVIVSWFCNRRNYDVGMMMANLRGRIEGLPKDGLAGNYEQEIRYFKDSFKTPENVREQLLRRLNNDKITQEEIDATVPSAATNFGAHWGVTSNWASFLNLKEKAPIMYFENCEQTLHLPLLKSKGFFDACLIFSPTPGKIGVFMADRPGAEDISANDPMLGERIL